MTRQSLRSRLAVRRSRIATVLLRESDAGQGLHLDPAMADPPPEPALPGWSAALASDAMRLYVESLRPVGGGSVRDGVIGDLGAYYDIASEDVVHRCLHWEEETVSEWQNAAATAGSRSGLTEKLAAFYDSTESWSFDLLWFAYLQASKHAYPSAVVIADNVDLPDDSAVLDFGSGVGATANLFAALGHRVTLADLASPLLAFARWRLEARGVRADYLQRPQPLPARAYDLIVSTDTLPHVPDAQAVAGELHGALKPGGLLATNEFDIRRSSSEANALHLYEDDLPLRWALARAGFARRRVIDGQVLIFQAISTQGLTWQVRRAVSWARFASPVARGVRAVRRAAARRLLVTAGRADG